MVFQKEESIKWAKNPYAFISVLFNSDENSAPITVEELYKFFEEYNEWDQNKKETWLDYLVERHILVYTEYGLLKYSKDSVQVTPEFNKRSLERLKS